MTATELKEMLDTLDRRIAAGEITPSFALTLCATVLLQDAARAAPAAVAYAAPPPFASEGDARFMAGWRAGYVRGTRSTAEEAEKVFGVPRVHPTAAFETAVVEFRATIERAVKEAT